jgi:hypothetical protein
LYGKLWKIHKFLKQNNIDVNTIQEIIKHSDSSVFPYQYLWKQNKEECISLIKQSDVIIFVQYYNQEIINLSKNKQKIGLFVGNAPPSNLDYFKKECDFLLTDNSSIYPYAKEIFLNT